METRVQYDDGVKTWDVRAVSSNEYRVYESILRTCYPSLGWEITHPISRGSDGVYRRVANPTSEDINQWLIRLAASADHDISIKARRILIAKHTVNTGVDYMMKRCGNSTKITVLSHRDITVPHMSSYSYIELMYSGAHIYSRDLHTQMWFILHPPTLVAEDHLALTDKFDCELFKSWVKDVSSHDYSEFPYNKLIDALGVLKNATIPSDLEGEMLLVHILDEWKRVI
jgi:hypothetical protein